MDINILNALDRVPPDLPRDDWYKILAAVKSELGAAGKDIADNWSRCDSYKQSDFNATWNSLNGNGGITIGTLFHYAKQYGFKPEKVADHNDPIKLNNIEATKKEPDNNHSLVAMNCVTRWGNATEVDRHPYLLKKACNAYGIKVEGENLLIPLRDGDGNIWSLQTISPDGKKLFAKGGRAKGMYHRIPGEGKIVICEGYATGATIHEATGYNVAVTFSCSNMAAVAKTIRQKLPDQQITIAADSAPEATTETAREVAKAIKADLAIPSVESDFNDLSLESGLDAVTEQIDSAVKVRKPKGDISWIDDFKLTNQEVDELAHPDWIYKDVIVQGHLIVIPAAPGAGKTTIMMYLAGEIASNYNVCYVNADVGSGDVKVMQHMADEKGFSLLLPDMKAGLSMMNVVDQMEMMNETNADYSEHVFIFDTYKKMTDVINKSSAKKLLGMLRGLTAKGMTIIMLAHTNKYDDAEGLPIYEGTGDLRSDVDDLIYLIPKKNDDGTMTVSTDPLASTAKRRGTHQPITFDISATRQVSRADYVDTATQINQEKQLEKDATIIEAVTKSIQSGEFKQTGIVDYCREHHHVGRPSCEAVLKRYLRKLWNRSKGFEKNVWVYKLT